MLPCALCYRFSPNFPKRLLMQMPSIPSVEPGVKPRNQLESDAPNQSVLITRKVRGTCLYCHLLSSFNNWVPGFTWHAWKGMWVWLLLYRKLGTALRTCSQRCGGVHMNFKDVQRTSSSSTEFNRVQPSSTGFNRV